MFSRQLKHILGVFRSSHVTSITTPAVAVCEDSDTMIDVVRRVIRNFSNSQNGAADNAFYVMDLGYFVQAIEDWKRLLPRVYPYYAVKVNPDPVLLQMMTKLHFGFDCASLNEIQTVTDMGTPPSRIVYAHTRKQPSHLSYATSVGVKYATFDDEDELYKIKRIAPDMGLLLRISTAGFATSNSESEGMLTKFGCPIHETQSLLDKARELDLSIRGVSFHVGCSCTDPFAYQRAIREAKSVFMQGRDLGFDMNVLDIGGGFPCETTNNYSELEFEKVADVISNSLDTLFPKETSVQVIAEPGAYFTMPSAVLVTNIIGKRNNKHKIGFGLQDDCPDVEYFINDGNQSSLFVYNLVSTQVTPVVKPVSSEHIDTPHLRSRIYGQTCDEDIVLNECQLPNMNTGDWVYFTDVGAYSSVYCTNFNGFGQPPIFRFISQTMRERLEKLISEGVFQHLPGYLTENRITEDITFRIF